MPRLLLVRHGESAWNAAGRWQGWADPPLSALGKAQAAEAAGRLDGVGLSKIVSSDLRRARQTATILARRLGLGVPEVEPGLRERDVGDWSGLTSPQIDERWPGMRQLWRQGALASPPNGETHQRFAGRVATALARVASRAGNDVVLVIAHGGVIRAVERHAGVDALTLPNLGGRWFEVVDGEVRAGQVVTLLDADTPAVAPVF